MQRAIVVRGTLLKDGRTIVLDESVEGVEMAVEVVLREVAAMRPEDTGESVIAIVRRADVESAIRGDLDVEMIHRPSASGSPGEDVTESPVVLGRRVSATIRTGPPLVDDGPPSGE